MFSTARHWIIAGTAAVVLVALAGFMLVVNPARDEAAAIRDQVAETEAASQMLANKVATLRQQAKQLPAKRAQIARIKRQMPSALAQPAMVRQLDDAAAAAGINLLGIAPGTPATSANATAGTVELPVTVTARGSYTAIKEFVDELEHLPRVFLIRDFTITENTSDGSGFDLSLNGVFFLLPTGALEQSAATGSATAAAPGSATTGGATTGTSTDGSSTGGTNTNTQ